MSSLTFATLVVATGTLFLVSGPVTAQPGPAAAKPLPASLTVQQIEKSLDSAKRTVGRLEGMKRATAALAILLIFLTAATGLMQVLNKQWVKTATAVLAVCATATTLVRQQFFPLDYQTCQSAIDEVSPLIDEVEVTLKFYRDPETKDEDRPRTLEALLDRQPSLERFNKIFRAGGAGTQSGGTKSVSLGGPFTLYAAADVPQYQQQQQSNTPRATSIIASAEAIATNKSAAYDYAKYLAAERIARQLNPPDGLLDGYIQYVVSKGLLRGSACDPAGKEQFRCRIDMSLPNSYARSDVVKSFANAPVAERSIQVSAPIDPNKQNIVVTAKAKSSVDGQFEFRFVNEKGQLRLWSLSCQWAGTLAGSEAWSFDLELSGKKLHLPINRYEKRIIYQIDPKNGRSLPIVPGKVAELAITATKLTEGGETFKR